MKSLKEEAKIVLGEYKKTVDKAQEQFTKAVEKLSQSSTLTVDDFDAHFRKEAGRCGQAISAAGKTARRDFAVIALRRENRAEYDLTPHGVMHFLDDLLGSKCNWKVLVDNFATHGRQQGDKSKMTGEQWGEIRERLQPLIEVLDGQIDGYRLLAAIQPRKKRSDYARAFKAKHQKQAE